MIKKLIRLALLTLLVNITAPLLYFTGVTVAPMYSNYMKESREQIFIKTRLQGEQIPALYRKDIVMILSTDMSRGSGTLLEPGVVLTAAHVPGDNKSAMILEPGVGLVSYNVVAIDRTSDIAIMVKPGVEITAKSLDKIARNNPGDKVLAVGFGANSKMMAVEAVDMGADTFTEDINTDTFSDSFIGGMSGGGIFNAEGKVVSLVSRGYNVKFNFTESEVEDIIEEYNNHLSGKKLTSGDNIFLGYLMTHPSMGVSDEYLERYVTAAIGLRG